MLPVIQHCPNDMVFFLFQTLGARRGILYCSAQEVPEGIDGKKKLNRRARSQTCNRWQPQTIKPGFLMYSFFFQVKLSSLVTHFHFRWIKNISRWETAIRQGKIKTLSRHTKPFSQQSVNMTVMQSISSMSLVTQWWKICVSTSIVFWCSIYIKEALTTELKDRIKHQCLYDSATVLSPWMKTLLCVTSSSGV